MSVKELIQHAIEKNPSMFQEEFDKVLKEKIYSKLTESDDDEDYMDDDDEDDMDDDEDYMDDDDE